jgi:glycosyltransferase involved in cell wall biosynthesis
MISVIICSANKHLSDKLAVNIEKTIQSPFEIIIIDNSQNPRGICEVYNTGALQAIYPVVCFMHEDIYFETIGWGPKITAHLNDDRIGLIGVAGGDTKSRVPSSWSSLIFASEICLVQHFKDKCRPPERFMRTGYPHDHSSCKPVTCIDGVFMCTRRDIFDKYKFDDKTFTGFHGYDIDFSLQVSGEYRVCAISDIIIHHFSEGSFNKAWLENAIKLSEKWKKQLPKSVRNLSKSDYVHQHWTAMRSFLEKLISLDYKLPVILIYFFRYSFNRYFHLRHWLHFLKVIFIKKFSIPAGHAAKAK